MRGGDAQRFDGLFTIAMVRKILLLVLLPPLLLVAACSYGYDFVVINKSAGTIEVRYQLKRWTPETPGKFVDFHPPAELTEEEFQKSEHHWRTAPKDQNRGRRAVKSKNEG